MEGQPLIGDRWNGNILLNGQVSYIYTWTEDIPKRFGGIEVEKENLSKLFYNIHSINYKNNIDEKAENNPFGGYFFATSGDKISPTPEFPVLCVFKFDITE